MVLQSGGLVLQPWWMISIESIIYNLPYNIHSDEIMNAPHWNAIVSFYIKRLLVITYNIYHGNSIEPLNDLIMKPETTYNYFRKSLKWGL